MRLGIRNLGSQVSCKHLPRQKSGCDQPSYKTASGQLRLRIYRIYRHAPSTAKHSQAEKKHKETSCMLHDHVIDEPYILHFGQHPTTMFFVSVGLVVGPRYEDHCLIGSNQTLLNNIM